MATYERVETVTRRVEFRVPTNPPWGADWVEVQKAISAAIAELRAEGEVGPADEPTADRIRMLTTDEAITVFYDMEA